MAVGLRVLSRTKPKSHLYDFGWCHPLTLRRVLEGGWLCSTQRGREIRVAAVRGLCRKQVAKARFFCWVAEFYSGASGEMPRTPRRPLQRRLTSTGTQLHEHTLGASSFGIVVGVDQLAQVWRVITAMIVLGLHPEERQPILHVGRVSDPLTVEFSLELFRCRPRL